MSANNYCRWCGRKYDWLNSTASDRGYFCSKRCEVAAHRAGAAPRGRSFESHLDSCLGRGIVYFLVISVIIGIINMFTGGDEKKQDKKATQRTEQVDKTDKRGTQAAKKSVKKVVPVVESTQIENVPIEDTLQIVPGETSATTTNEEEAVTTEISAIQANEKQDNENLVQEQVEGQSEEVTEETPRNTTVEEN